MLRVKHPAPKHMDKSAFTKNQLKLQKLLRDLREAVGLKQQEVADQIDEPQSFVSKYESGERRLDILELREICRALGLTLTEFSSRLETVIK